jgi:pimeloyl-ACP methyl ester carboxylesterase
MRVRRLYVDGPQGQLHVRHAAPAEDHGKTPLVLVHQTPSSSREYETLIAYMAADRPVFAIDTPGYGMSDRPDGPMLIDDYAKALLAGIDALGIERCDLFGYHTGTFMAVEIARIAPDRARRLVLSGIPWRAADDRAVRLANARATPPLAEDGAALFARLHWLWDFSVGARDSRVPLRRAAELFAERAYPLDRYWWAYEGVWNYDAAARFPPVQQPVLMLLPHEPLLEPSRIAAAFFSDVRFIEFPNLDREIFEAETGVIDIAAAMRTFLI